MTKLSEKTTSSYPPKMTFKQLKSILRESTEEEFSAILKQAYPRLSKDAALAVTKLYASEGWYPDDVEELKSDLPDIVSSRATPVMKKTIMAAVKKAEAASDDDDDDDDDAEYNERHAREWMERHPHGWYNNEHDYGVGDDEEEEADDVVVVDEDYRDFIPRVADFYRTEYTEHGPAELPAGLNTSESRKRIVESEELAASNARKMKAFVDRYGVDALIRIVAKSEVSRNQDMFDFDNALAETFNTSGGPANDYYGEDVEAMANEFGIDEDAVSSYLYPHGVSKYMNFIYDVEEDEYDEIESAYDDYSGEVGVASIDVDGLEADEDCVARGVTFDKVLDYYKKRYDVIGVYDGVEEGRMKPGYKDIVIAGERKSVVAERHASGRAERRAAKVKKEVRRKDRQSR